MLCSAHEQVMMIAINRPEKRNCVNPSTAAQLNKAIEDFENNDEMKVAVLYGKGEICKPLQFTKLLSAFYIL